MKKLVLPMLTTIVISASACAQKLDASKVPSAVKESFSKQYPGATAKWEKEDGKYEAGFKQNGTATSVLFEANGKLAESEVEIKKSELPAAALAYVAEHYKGKEIKEAAKITKSNGTVNYEAEVGGKDVIFDASGKFLEEIKG